MSEAIVANRYADALFQLANEMNQTENFLSQIEVVSTAFTENPALMELLDHPKVSFEKKAEMIDASFNKCDKQIINTIKLLVERQRIGLIQEIATHFIHLYNEANGIAAAKVYSVRELSDDEKQQVEASLTKQLKKSKVLIENIIDPSLLGGLKIRVGNTIYDGTISGRLNRMKHNIGSATI